MARFIIIFGMMADAAVFEADTLDAATSEARNRSTAVGVDAEALDDVACAEAFSEERALELGLIESDPRDVKLRVWRSEAPWRG